MNALIVGDFVIYSKDLRISQLAKYMNILKTNVPIFDISSLKFHVLNKKPDFLVFNCCSGHFDVIEVIETLKEINLSVVNNSKIVAAAIYVCKNFDLSIIEEYKEYSFFKLYVLDGTEIQLKEIIENSIKFFISIN